MTTRKTPWWLVIAMVVMVMTGSALGQSPSAARTATTAGDSCHDALPAGISHSLAEQFAGWVVQTPDRLTSSARNRWQAEKPLSCPGIADGRFTGADRKALAVLVVGSGDNKGQAKLLSFVESDAGYHAEVLEQISSGAGNYFIHGAKASQFFDAASAKKFRLAGADSIVLFDAGTEEYGVEVYFWTGTSFHHEPVDY